MPTTLFKYPSEIRSYSFDFSSFEEIAEGDTIASIISVTATPDGLTLGTRSIDGATVRVVISDGTGGTVYRVNCLVATSSGARIEGQGFLQLLPE